MKGCHTKGHWRGLWCQRHIVNGLRFAPLKFCEATTGEPDLEWHDFSVNFFQWPDASLMWLDVTIRLINQLVTNTYSTLWVTGQDVLGCLWALCMSSYWAENPFYRYIYIICLLCDRATARNHWEWVELQVVKYLPQPLTGHSPSWTFSRDKTCCFTSYIIVYII